MSINQDEIIQPHQLGANLTLFPDDQPTSKLLMDESPLVVLPSLACVVGLNEAIVLQQLHYRLREKARKQRAGSFRLGRYWVFDKYEDWQKVFPFWSERTVQRIFRSLEEQGVVLWEQFGKRDRDRRKWYAVEYLTLARLEKEFRERQESSDDANLSSSDDANLSSSDDANLSSSDDANLSSSLPKTSPKSFPKDIHTQEAAAVASGEKSVRGSNSSGSKFTTGERYEHAQRYELGGGWLTLSEDGRYDRMIDFYRELERQKLTPEPEVQRNYECQKCYGSRMEIVEGKGARPCPDCRD